MSFSDLSDKELCALLEIKQKELLTLRRLVEDAVAKTEVIASRRSDEFAYAGVV